MRSPGTPGGWAQKKECANVGGREVCSNQYTDGKGTYVNEAPYISSNSAPRLQQQQQPASASTSAGQECKNRKYVDGKCYRICGPGCATNMSCYGSKTRIDDNICGV